MQIVAATWYAYTLTDSAAAVGALAFLALGPSLVGGPVGGVLLDRFDPRRLAIVLSSMAAIPPGFMAAMDLAGDLSLGWLYVLVFAGAIPRSLYEPVVSLIGPSTVPTEWRHAAVARMSLSYNVTRLFGAAAGGLVVHWAGVWAAFGLNAASFVIFAAVLVRTPLESDIVRPTDTPRGAGLGEAVQQAKAVPSVRVAAVAVAVFFMFVAPIEQLIPVVAREHGLTARSVGFLASALGVGALLAYPIIGHRMSAGHRQQRLMQVGLLFGAAGLITLALTPTHGIGVDLLAAMLIGFGWELVFVGGKSTVAVEVASEVRGRAMGLFFLLFSGSMAIGAVALALLHDWLGTTWTLLGTAAAVLTAGWYLASLTSRKRRTASA
jgi:MFS family permease